MRYANGVYFGRHFCKRETECEACCRGHRAISDVQPIRAFELPDSNLLSELTTGIYEADRTEP